MQLQPPVLARLLRELSQHELTRLVQVYEQQAAIEANSDLLARVADEFLRLRARNPTAHLREALDLAFGEGAEQILQHDRWKTISERINPKALATVLKDERMEAIAIVLAQFPARYSAEVLALLPDEKRAASVEQMARTEAVSGSALDALARALEESLRGRTNFDGDKSTGIKSAAAMLNQLDSETASSIIERIRQTDPRRATWIEQEMFHFEDLIKLDSLVVQRVLSTVQPEKIALALKGLSDSTRNAVLESLADQVKAIVKQEIEDSGKVPLHEVRAARREITAGAIQMEREGKIRLRVDQDLIA
jgi:flagellar motor switch protein FliG